MNGDRRISPPFEATNGPAALAEARFIPQRYEPNYAYPLLALFHGRGGDEHQMLASMPALSWRNYIGLSLRGPEPLTRKGAPAGYGWGPTFTRPSRMERHFGPVEPPGDVVRRVLRGDPPDAIDSLEDGVFAAVRDARRSLHVHSERIFLVGVGEGASVAYRLGLRHPERFAGVVAINGWLPGGPAPLVRLRDCRDLRILVVHGQWNARAPIEVARRDVSLLRAGGLKVAFQAYPNGHRITGPMLSDVDTWLMNQCTEGLI
jgi:phospholipase/carboxylesterase